MGRDSAGDGRIAVRPAGEEELPTVMAILNAAVLELDAGTVRDRLTEPDSDVDASGGVLVAVEGDRVLGACVVDPSGGGADADGGGGARVDAIAVRPGRRGQGIGTALVEDAANRWGALGAEFDSRVRPFYESLGFDVEPVGDAGERGGDASGSSRDGRFRGRRG